MNNRDLFIYAQTKKSKRTLSETKSTLKSLIDRSITRIEVPDGITSIGKKAFYECSELITVVLHNGVIDTQLQSFALCTSLKNINFPDSVTTIGAQTFYNCSSLENVILPSGIKVINSLAFNSCVSLSDVTLPASLETIGSTIFSGCSALENVTFESGFNANGLDLSVSTLYSVNTLVTMLNALANRTGQVPYTLTLGSTNLAKLNNEQIAIATEKNWTLA